jgi:TRAP-type C4-dicarboxylate transport system permease small subunit
VTRSGRTSSTAFERAVDSVIDGAEMLSEWVVAALAVLISLDAILRWLANWSFQFVDEVGGYALLLLSFFGMAIALHRDALFRVEGVIDRIPSRLRARLLWIYDCAALGFATLLCWQLGSLALRSFERAITAPTALRTPLWIPQSMMALGALILVLALLAQLLRGARRVRELKEESKP